MSFALTVPRPSSQDLNLTVDAGEVLFLLGQMERENPA
jgi:hypothetical protein